MKHKKTTLLRENGEDKKTKKSLVFYRINCVVHERIGSKPKKNIISYKTNLTRQLQHF